MDQQFSLRWTNYLNQLTDAFGSLRYDEDLVDVTLSCEGKRLKAHKMLLSACSSYFRDVFKENPCQHPVIVFKNVKYTDLAAIVDFMYKGEVQVVQDQLESFLGTAELLEVKGLTEGSGKTSFEEEETTMGSAEVAKRYDARHQNTSPVTQIPATSISSSPPVKKRKYGVPTKTATKSTTEIHSLVPKIENEEITGDAIFEDDQEQHLSSIDPLQDALAESNTAGSLEFNANANVPQDSQGQMLMTEPRNLLEGAPQEAMQVEDLDTVKLDSTIGDKNKNEFVINNTVEIEDEGLKGMDKVNEDPTSNNLCDSMSEEINLKDNTSVSEITIHRSEIEKNTETATDTKPLLIEKASVKLPKGLTVTVSSAKGVIAGVKQPDEEIIALRSEEAKTPAQEDLFSCQSNDTQETDTEATVATDQIQLIEPETAFEAPEGEMSCVPEERPVEPEFDYYGCESCKVDKKPFENIYIFSHKCPICPCSCFCAHLLKEHMKYIHGWFNVQRRFTQF